MFNGLLDEGEGFKYQITVKIFLQKYKVEFSHVYFNSTTKTVINHKFDLKKAVREILYNTERWVNEGSGWIIKKIHSQ